VNNQSTQTLKRIIVGLSGGVDSSIAAYLLKNQGHHVEALFMKNWEEDDENGNCNAAEDYTDALSISKQLAIQLHERNFSTEYWDNVFQGCLNEFKAGRTPNPDILCNKEIKFNVFLDHAIDLGADVIATGHYAQIKYIDNLYRLFKAVDTNKDQTYFLYTLNQHQLASSLFPLGTMTKNSVRDIAKNQHFITHDKKDSTGICFIGERNFKQFLKRFIDEKPGDICTTLGEIIGRHDGLMFHTIGQRKGLNIGGHKLTHSENTGEPWYVVKKDMQSNTLIVAQGQDHPMLFSRKLLASQLHWISGKAPVTPYQCNAKTRYRQADQQCIITALSNKESNKEPNKESNSENESICEVTFENTQRAITPGQSIVFYQGDECLGGGIITNTLK